MTLDELQRLAVVETKVSAVERRLCDIDGKLDELIEAKNLGRGALWLFLKIAALISAVMAAVAWASQHLVIR